MSFSDQELEELFTLFDPEEKGTVTLGHVCCILRTLELDINEVQVKKLLGGAGSPAEKWEFSDVLNLVDQIKAQAGVPAMPHRLASMQEMDPEAEKNFRAVDKLADTVNRVCAALAVRFIFILNRKINFSELNFSSAWNISRGTLLILKQCSTR